MSRCHCACRDVCGHADCPIRPFVRLFALIKEPRRDSAQWWAATRESRDGVLAVLRAGPDQTLEADDARFWADYLKSIERLSVKLDRDYIRFIESRGYSGLRGTA